MGLLTSIRSSISELFAANEPKRIGIYGPPNAGKCLAAGESIMLADGTHRRIEDIFESVAETDPTDVSDEPDEKWLECDGDVRVPALGPDLSVEPSPVSHVFRQRYAGPMYRVRTAKGREVTVSPKHPFIAVTSDGAEQLTAAELEPGTQVAHLSSFTPEPSDWTLPDTPELVADGGTATAENGSSPGFEGELVTCKATHHDPKSIVPLSLDAEVARFLALTIGEAQHKETFVAFANENERFRTAFRTTVERFGVDTTTYDYEDKTPIVRVNSKALVEHLRRLDCPPAPSAAKRVPEPVLRADDDIVAEFLRTLFDCEGSVQGADGAERGRYVTISSASRELLVGVQTLLVRFDIVGKLRRKRHDGKTYHELCIGRSDQHRRFRDAVGFGIDRKADRLDSLCEAESSPTTHTLPLMERFETLRTDLGLTQAEFYGDSKHVARMRRRNSISQDRIESMAGSLPSTEAFDLVHRFAGADVTWDAVTEIERIEYDGYIYDLTVPGEHTFATADGLVVHNTTLANRIARDWTGDAVGPESHVPHETRRARRKENVEIKRNGSSVNIDIVDTPGVTTKVDYTEFLEHDIEEDDAIRRSREATEGVAEAMHWLREDVDGVIYVLDATTDPFTQVNTMLIGIIESQDLPVLIFANKIDLEDASVQRIRNAFPQHETVPLSALEGDNMDEVYDKIAEYFG